MNQWVGYHTLSVPERDGGDDIQARLVTIRLGAENPSTGEFLFLFFNGKKTPGLCRTAAEQAHKSAVDKAHVPWRPSGVRASHNCNSKVTADTLGPWIAHLSLLQVRTGSQRSAVLLHDH